MRPWCGRHGVSTSASPLNAVFVKAPSFAVVDVLEAYRWASSGDTPQRYFDVQIAVVKLYILKIRTAEVSVFWEADLIVIWSALTKAHSREGCYWPQLGPTLGRIVLGSHRIMPSGCARDC